MRGGQGPGPSDRKDGNTLQVSSAVYRSDSGSPEPSDGARSVASNRKRGRSPRDTLGQDTPPPPQTRLPPAPERSRSRSRSLPMVPDQSQDVDMGDSRSPSPVRVSKTAPAAFTPASALPASGSLQGSLQIPGMENYQDSISGSQPASQAASTFDVESPANLRTLDATIANQTIHGKEQEGSGPGVGPGPDLPMTGPNLPQGFDAGPGPVGIKSGYPSG